jgi:hypothetical protein
MIGGAYYFALRKMTHREDTHDLSNQIGELSQKFIDDKQAKSFVIGIYKNGKTYTQGYGKIDSLKGLPPNDSTLFGTTAACTLSQKTLSAAIVELKKAAEQPPSDWKTYSRLSWVGTEDIIWNNEQKCTFYQYSGFFSKSKTGIVIISQGGRPAAIDQFALDILLLSASVSMQ